MTPGAPLHSMFKPMFVDNDEIWYKSWELDQDNEDEGASLGAMHATATMAAVAAAPMEPTAAAPLAKDHDFAGHNGFAGHNPTWTLAVHK